MMTLLSDLQKNKNTVSTAFGKKMAQEILNGKIDLVPAAINLVNHPDVNVRAGAAKIVELVAEKKPHLISDNLETLFPALSVEESITKWVIIYVFGLCAQLQPAYAKKAFPYAEDFLTDDSLCLQDRAITYLGYIGALSQKEAARVFPILEKTLSSIPKRITRIFEGFERMIPVMDTKQKNRMKKIAATYQQNTSPSIAAYAKRILKQLEKH